MHVVAGKARSSRVVCRPRGGLGLAVAIAAILLTALRPSVAVADARTAEKLRLDWSGAVYLIKVRRTGTADCGPDDLRGAERWATGFAVTSDGDILTAAHTFRDGNGPSFFNETTACGWIFAWTDAGLSDPVPLDLSPAGLRPSATGDFALLRVKSLPAGKAVLFQRDKLEEQEIEQSEDLYFLGFEAPSGDPKLTAAPKSAQKTLLTTCTAQADSCEVNGGAVSGNSGAPVFTAGGRIVGLIRKTAVNVGDRAQIAHIGGARKLLEGVLPKDPCPKWSRDGRDPLRIRILLAQLEHDEDDGSQTDNLASELGNQLVRSELDVDVSRLTDPVREANKGLALVKECGAHVLIRGRVGQNQPLVVYLGFDVEDRKISIFDENGKLMLHPKAVFANDTLELKLDIAGQVVLAQLLPPIIFSIVNKSQPRELADRTKRVFRRVEAAAEAAPPHQQEFLWDWTARIEYKLGHVGADIERLEKAEAFWTRMSDGRAHDERWARLQRNLGGSRYLRGLLKVGNKASKEEVVATYEAAVEAYRAALDVFSKDANTSDWAESRFGFATAKALLFSATDKSEHLDEAEIALQEVVDEYGLVAKRSEADRLQAEEPQARFQFWLGVLLKRDVRNAARLHRALAAADAAQQYYTEARSQIVWADLQEALGDIYLRLANVEHSREHATKAADAYASAAKHGDAGETAVRHCGRGKALAFLGDKEGALAAHDAAIASDPTYPGAYVERAMLLREKGDNAGAIADLSKGIEKLSTDPALYTRRGDVYYLTKAYDRAIADYSRAIELAPKSAKPYYGRGRSYRAQGDFKRALSDFATAIELDPNAVEARTERARLYIINAQYDLAIEDFSKVVDAKPTEGDGYLGRGAAHEAKGEFDAAVADYRKAAELAPASSEPHRRQGIVAYYKQDFAGAIKELERAFAGSDDAYAALFLHLAQARSGTAGTAALTAEAAQLKPGEWPYPVVEFYLGKRSESSLLSTASSTQERCEANFYVGEQHLLGANKAEAAKALGVAVKICPTHFIEYQAAKADLTRLEAAQTQ